MRHLTGDTVINADVSSMLQRGKTPVVVGGTGFYLRWYIYGKPNTPVSNEQLAAAAQAKLDQVRFLHAHHAVHSAVYFGLVSALNWSL